MKQKKPKFMLVLGVALALGAVLTACTPPTISGGGGASGSSPTPPNNSSQVNDDETAEEAAGDLDPATCLVGAWTAGNDFFLAASHEFGDEIKSVQGEVVVTFADDGTMTHEYRGWLLTAVSEGYTVTIQRDGTDIGTFSADASTVDLQETQMGSSLVVGGEGMSMTVAADPMNYTTAPYTCDQSKAIITTSDGAVELTRR